MFDLAKSGLSASADILKPMTSVVFLSNAEPVVLSIIDIKDHVDNIPFQKRLHFALGLPGNAYRFEVTITDG